MPSDNRRVWECVNSYLYSPNRDVRTIIRNSQIKIVPVLLYSPSGIYYIEQKIIMIQLIGCPRPAPCISGTSGSKILPYLIGPSYCLCARKGRATIPTELKVKLKIKCTGMKRVCIIVPVYCIVVQRTIIIDFPIAAGQYSISIGACP
jgi:hypothetical protein